MAAAIWDFPGPVFVGVTHDATLQEDRKFFQGNETAGESFSEELSSKRWQESRMTRDPLPVQSETYTHGMTSFRTSLYCLSSKTLLFFKLPVAINNANHNQFFFRQAAMIRRRIVEDSNEPYKFLYLLNFVANLLWIRTNFL